MFSVEALAKVISIISVPIKELIHDKEFQRMVLGDYSDGRIRNVRDAWTGEYLSPKQKKKAMKAKNKKKTK